jgi:hypothetical protein
MSEEYRMERPLNRVDRHSEPDRHDWTMGPKVRALGGLAVGSVISLVVFLSVFLAVTNGSRDSFMELAFAFVMGLLALPSLRMVANGASELLGSETGGRGAGRLAASSAKRQEQQVLEVIERHGAVTPARVAMETTLTVAEADKKLHELAEKGHLEVRVQGGKLAYSL